MSSTHQEPNLNSVEEGIPTAPPSDNNGASIPGVKRHLSTHLSFVSKKYDVDGDGKLDAAEQAMRDMDKEGYGYLTNDKVYTIFQEQLHMQKQLLYAKRTIIFCGAVLIFLAAANVGVSFAAANLAKDTSTNNNNVLVVKENGQVVATNNHASVYGANTSSSSRRRRTQVIADGTTTTQEETTISRANAQTMLSDCQSGGSAQVARSWEGIWETVDALNVNIPVCPGGTFAGSANGNSFHFTLSDYRTIDIQCQQGSDVCVMTGSGIQQQAGEACVYDADCLYMATCVGVDASTGTPGSCILPFQASGCQFVNGGSDCETDYCFTGGFSPPIYGYCSCHPETNAGCTSPTQCYTGDEQGFSDSGPACLLPVGESGCAQDYECVGRNVFCVSGVCTQGATQQ
jgi:hypothetical protein